jgi:hypothetical protein
MIKPKQAWLGVAIVFALVLSGCSNNGEALTTDHDGGVTDCLPSASPADWTQLHSRIIEYGLEIYRLHNRGTKVTVTSAQLWEPSGNIALDKVAFQAGAGVGSGIDWNSDVQAIDSEGHGVPTLRRPLPATLSYAMPPTPDSNDDGLRWQLTVGLRLTGAGGGMAQGISFAYDAGGGHQHTIIDHHPMGIFRTDAECNVRVVLPTP